MSLPSRPRAVVTGAGSGLGRALCEALAARQARVMVSDMNPASAEETARRVTALGGEARVHPCDVTDPDAVEALARATDDAFGGVDLVVNNAGVATGGAVGVLPLAEWKRVLDVNLWGVIHGCHAFVPRLRKQGSGHVLNIASAAGLVYAPNLAAYNTSKAAVVALSETLYAELQPLGLGVTVACPTFFRTNIAAAAAPYSDPETRRMSVKLVDQSKIGPEWVAERLLKAVDRGAPHVLPMADARWFWRLRRLAPGLFLRGVIAVEKRMRERTARIPG
ncbi:SDR family NAD(P)-dependent oxidoreductase [Corallococcus carmarthensis]|uniref:SDR family NAD(P)-dependent oxidoreductase n=1 Tax=Corallococcus carmarthensis TaxID=2316728 RepID=A0A3A8KDA1_9BACT|nr:SDR family NAD(P)-dependent oxidoreductase [Corallococcus carmarthensis]NOK21252.1 SDR family NAD(P)-dependent oxidoreductase [Corallococcus carmarthensis]RKH00412.1 SDR family NAD(P)-dependent oxidoreductase [Corallococcus carmarthensis]